MGISSQQTAPPYDPEYLRRSRRDARVTRRSRRRRGRIILLATLTMSVILLALTGVAYLQIQRILTPAYAAINGIPCDDAEHIDFHIHAHVTIYINGQKALIPRNIGIAPDFSCFYWLHTHTSDGIIHIEAPQPQSNEALDDFLTIWHNGFSKLGFPQELTRETGWKIFVNGKPFTAPITSPLHTEVPLNSHAIITLEYGLPIMPPDTATTYHFPPNLIE
ncbi:MAG: hypothetical protein NVS4B12_12540 [Ktedonobacteraceae bacterium]